MHKTIQEACSEFLRSLFAERTTMGLAELELQVRYAIVAETLNWCQGNQCRAAAALRVHRNTLSRYIHEMEEAGLPNPARTAKHKRDLIKHPQGIRPGKQSASA